MYMRFTRLTQIIFVHVGLVLMIAPSNWWPVYYKPIPMGLIAIIYALIIQLPRWILKPSREVDRFQLALTIGLIFSGIGSLGAWGHQIGGIVSYDKFVHFLLPCLMMVSGAPLLAHLNGWSRTRAVLTALAIIVASGVLWEYIEYTFAAYFHVGYFGALFDHDSQMDIVTNTIGAIIGILFVP